MICNKCPGMLNGRSCVSILEIIIQHRDSLPLFVLYFRHSMSDDNHSGSADLET